MSKPRKRPGMASEGLTGFVLDPVQCSKLNMEEKRELVCEIAQWSQNAPEILSSLTRREILEIICAEMGKERKYSGYTKLQMIEHLLKLISQKPKRISSESSSQNPKRSNSESISQNPKKRSNSESNVSISAAKTQSGFKKQRRKEAQLQQSTKLTCDYVENNKEEQVKTRVCQNVACKAALSHDDAFCKRCSCCICHYYDDNKDPSLWLTCGSDSLGENSCGLSCHLTCALKDEGAGIMKIGNRPKLDGSFSCVACGKVNGLMRTWRKQLLIAKEARRVDALCLRVLLGYRILAGTGKYNEMQKIMETAFQMLKTEVGPLELVCANMARGIVNRLSCGTEVQKLCAYAVEAFDSMSSDHFPSDFEKKEPASCQIRFEESSPTSVIIVLEYAHNLFKDFMGCMLWHRKSAVRDYPDRPTFIVLKPEKRFKITDLSPSTEYFCKVSLFSSSEILGIWEGKWVTPTSKRNSSRAFSEVRKKGNPIISQTHSHAKSTNSSNMKSGSGDQSPQPQTVKDIKNSKNAGLCVPPQSKEAVSLTSLESLSPSTPCKTNGKQDVLRFGCKKQMEESTYEYSVRVIKWLEHEGHIDESFRVKFLTWFSLKATMQERRVVHVFVDALVDDPPSLAEQLIHTFQDEICCEQKKPAPQHGFCARFWH